MIGQKVGPYEVVSLLGKGGMGEVYRARDLKLDRDVALKVLPGELYRDSDRLARFEREARTLAALQHQNIASIYGLESFDGQPVLVMELALGDDLDARIRAGNLSPEEIGKVARQLARGLEYAHEKGIVHRDLKPANIKVFGDGGVKILDFGLARAFGPGEAADGSGSTPFQATLTQGLTAAGTVLGTAAYMSPEQARGYNVDRRSDIWAFGVILFEMLTGNRLFEGETATDTLAAILRKEPEWELIPADARPLLVQICRRCLEKDPQKRMRDMGEVRVALEGNGATVVGLSGVGELAPAGPVPGSGPGPLPWIATGVLAAALGLVVFLTMTGAMGPQPAPPPLVHSSISLPAGIQLNLNPTAPGPVTVSPDSRRLAFAATDSAGQVLLYIRNLDQRDAVPIPGTAGAHYPFWAPDSRTVAFFTGNGKLARVDVEGGPVITICPAENGKGGDWNGKDQILFAPTHISSIFLVDANGGEPVDVTRLSGEADARSHRFPRWLPDGEGFLYIAVSRTGGDDGIDATLRQASLDGTVNRDLMPCQASVEYAAGRILFVHDAILMARPFDPRLGEFTAPATPLLPDVLAVPAAHLAIFSARESGVLTYCSGGVGFGHSQLMRAGPDGLAPTPFHRPLMTFGFDLSPDEKVLVLSLPDEKRGTFDLWLLEIERDLLTRLTFDSESEGGACFSPDGQWVAYFSDRSGRNNIYRKRAAGTGTPELVFESANDCVPADWSPDGNLLAYTESDTTGQFLLGVYDFTTGQARRLHAGSSYSEGSAHFSPDGRWLAYLSAETGQPEVFVESLRDDGGRWRVSASGGYHPQWSPAGDRLFFQTPGGEILAAEVTTNAGGGLQFGRTLSLISGAEFASNLTFRVGRATGQIIFKRSTRATQNSLLSMVAPWPQLMDQRPR